MRKALISIATLVAAVAAFQNCGGFRGSSASGATSLGTTTPIPTTTPSSFPGNLTRGFNGGLSGANIIPVTVGNCGYGVANTACVSVTICIPGSTTCQIIPNIQLSTASIGLRLFSSAVTIPLQTVTVGGNPIADCNTTTTTPLWGPVETADVILGNEPRVTTSIQIINSSYASAPAACAGAAPSASDWGANGILGVGVAMYDCGPDCEAKANEGVYYSCTGGTCSPSQVDIHSQIANPVALLPVDNNGVAITLPRFPAIRAHPPFQAPSFSGLGRKRTTRQFPQSDSMPTTL